MKCKCGCGENTTLYRGNYREFISGHNSRVKNRTGGQFKKGHKTWNKGTKGLVKPNSGSFKKGNIPKTHFKKGHIPWNKGVSHLDDERVARQYRNLKIFKKGNAPWNKGLIQPIPKEKHYNWQGGKSFEKYGIEFDRTCKHNVKVRDCFVCQHCFKHESELDTVLVIHHVNENKLDNDFSNLITLCRRCHGKIHVGGECL